MTGGIPGIIGGTPGIIGGIPLGEVIQETHNKYTMHNSLNWVFCIFTKAHLSSFRVASLVLGQGPFLAESQGRRLPEAVQLMLAVGRRVQPLRPHHLHQSHLGSAFSSDYLITKSRGIQLLWVYVGYKKSTRNMKLNVLPCVFCSSTRLLSSMSFSGIPSIPQISSSMSVLPGIALGTPSIVSL